MMNFREWEIEDESGTERLAVALATATNGPLVIGLVGTLGAGKTRFVQAFAAAMGIPRDEVLSPTFVLCQEYQGRLPIHHLDAYRIQDSEELVAIGIQEYFAGPGVTLLEWSDRVSELLPPDHLRITFLITSATHRRVRAEAFGTNSQEVLTRWGDISASPG